MNSIFSLAQALLGGFLYEFPHEVRQCAEPIVGASVDIYFRMSTDLLPTPAKSHYVFNLRDLSKCIQGASPLLPFSPFYLSPILSCIVLWVAGIFQADVGTVRDRRYIFRLFCHESLRVFHDRLIDHHDKNYFYEILAELSGKHFNDVSDVTSCSPSHFVRSLLHFV